MGIKIGNTDISKIKIASGLTPRLPSAYQEVEYIQSSGTQYINTGYTPLTTTEFDITYEWVSFLSQWQTPMGCRKDYNTQAYYFGWDKVNSRSFYGFGTNHADPSSVAFGGLGQIFNVTYKNGVISNGTNSANVTVSNAPYGHLCIFAEEHNGNVQEYSCMKLYGLKLYESGTLIRDFVPCYRISDSVIGLYDLVNDVFYTNSGTGVFDKGADVNLPYKEIKKVYLGSTKVRPTSKLPNTYQEVEYIQSSGTQYIDTGWYPSSNYCKVVMDGTVYSGNSSWSVFFGMTNGSNAYSLHTDHYSWQLNVGSVGNRGTGISFVSGTDGTFTFEANNGSISVDIAGSTYTGTYSGSIAQSTRPMYIFAFDENGSITWKATMRVNSFKIYSDANTIERDFVPCYRIADSVIGLYDLVNDVFYTNNGTGTFTKGPDVN